LQGGKSLYIEGVDFGAENHTEQLFPMFGCTFVDHGNASILGNVMSVAGQDGSFAAGTYYSYLYQRGPDSFVDEIEENGGTIFFKSQDSKGRAVYYGGPANSYRSIHSAVIFGALRNGGNTKDDLMDIYMDYLTELTGIEEYGDEQNSLSFAIFPNPMINSAHIRFSLEQPGHVSVKVYNTVGQLTRELVDTELTQGSHDIIWDGKDGAGRTLSSGSYIFRINVDGSVINKAVLIVK
jgi:hypothetical protein